MQSASAICYELDDPEEAARQLAASVKEKLALKKHAIGILFCDADCDGAAVTGELRELLGIDIAGMTSLAILENKGHHEGALTLLVLTAEDCFFSPAVSLPLSGDGYGAKIAEACKTSVSRAGDGYGSKPGLIFAFCPSGMPYSGDKYPEILSAAAQGVPVIGGVCSDDYDYQRARTFFSGNEYKDSMVLVSVWGNVKPVFSLRHVTSRFAERIRRVVEAEGNKVYKVGDETLVQYLEGFGLKTDVPDALLAFNSYPMMLTQEGGDETPLMRHIQSLNLAEGSGTFFGDVPTGTLANICLVSKKDVMAACRESMQRLLDETAGKDHGYSAILCITCCGRAMILGNDSGAEGTILAEMLPSGINLAGAYCLGEICPTRYGEGGGGGVSNRFHNCSITFCMF